MQPGRNFVNSFPFFFFFFLSLDADSFYSAISAVVAIHVVLASYLYLAFSEDSATGEGAEKKEKKKDK